MQKIFFSISFYEYVYSFSLSLLLFYLNKNIIFDNINIAHCQMKWFSRKNFSKMETNPNRARITLCGMWWGLMYWNNQMLNQLYSQMCMILSLCIVCRLEIRLKQLENYARNIFVWTYFFHFCKHHTAPSWRLSVLFLLPSRTYHVLSLSFSFVLLPFLTRSTYWSAHEVFQFALLSTLNK